MSTVSHTAAWTTGTPTAMNPASNSPNDCRISPLDGKIAVDIATKITVFDAALANPASWAAWSTTYTKIVFDPLTNFLLYIDTNGNQFFNLNVATGAAAALVGPGAILSASDFSKDGKYISTGGDGKVLYIYDSNRVSI